MDESKSTEYVAYLGAYLAFLNQDTVGSPPPEERLAVATCLGAADGTQARAMAGQPGQNGPESFLRGKADVAREVDRRLVTRGA